MNYKELDDLCREHIEDYDVKVGIAWGYIDRNRCPLWMAFPVLYDEMVDVVNDYAEDLGIDPDEVDFEEIISV